MSQPRRRPSLGDTQVLATPCPGRSSMGRSRPAPWRPVSAALVITCANLISSHHRAPDQRQQGKLKVLPTAAAAFVGACACTNAEPSDMTQNPAALLAHLPPLSRPSRPTPPPTPIWQCTRGRWRLTGGTCGSRRAHVPASSWTKTSWISGRVDLGLCVQVCKSAAVPRGQTLGLASSWP